MIEQPERVVVREILELDQHAGEHGPRGRDELFHERVVLGAAQPPLAQPDVIRVAHQLHVVGADVQYHRQAGVRVHARAGDVERELADRDAHPVRAEVAQPQYALAIGHDDDSGAVRPVAQHPGDVSAVVGGDEHAAGALEDVAEALAGEPDRRRVDERLHLVDVVADDAEEQRLVAVVQRGQRDVLAEVVGQPPQVLEEARGLLLLREENVRQQPAQAEPVSFLLREGSALVQGRIVQQVEAPGQAGSGRLCRFHHAVPPDE